MKQFCHKEYNDPINILEMHPKGLNVTIVLNNNTQNHTFMPSGRMSVTASFEAALRTGADSSLYL